MVRATSASEDLWWHQRLEQIVVRAAESSPLLRVATTMANNLLDWTMIGTNLAGKAAWIVATVGFLTLVPLFRSTEVIQLFDTVMEHEKQAQQQASGGGSSAAGLSGMSPMEQYMGKGKPGTLMPASPMVGDYDDAPERRGVSSKQNNGGGAAGVVAPQEPTDLRKKGSFRQQMLSNAETLVLSSNSPLLQARARARMQELEQQQAASRPRTAQEAFGAKITDHPFDIHPDHRDGIDRAYPIKMHYDTDVPGLGYGENMRRRFREVRAVMSDGSISNESLPLSSRPPTLSLDKDEALIDELVKTGSGVVPVILRYEVFENSGFPALPVAVAGVNPELYMSTVPELELDEADDDDDEIGGDLANALHEQRRRRMIYNLERLRHVPLFAPDDDPHTKLAKIHELTDNLEKQGVALAHLLRPRPFTRWRSHIPFADIQEILMWQETAVRKLETSAKELPAIYDAWEAEKKKVAESESDPTQPRRPRIQGVVLADLGLGDADKMVREARMQRQQQQQEQEQQQEQKQEQQA